MISIFCKSPYSNYKINIQNCSNKMAQYEKVKRFLICKLTFSKKKKTSAKIQKVQKIKLNHFAPRFDAWQ